MGGGKFKVFGYLCRAITLQRDMTVPKPDAKPGNFY